MSQPPAYTPTADFSQDESNNVAGRSTVRTAALDTELGNIADTLAVVLENMAIIQRDDTELMDEYVSPNSLSEGVRAMIAAAGVNPRGAWAALTAYTVMDAVQDSGITWLCATAHTSGASFSSTNWMQLTGGNIAGNSGKRYKIVSGRMVQSTDGGGWSITSDATRGPTNVSSVAVTGSGNLSLTHAFTAVKNCAFLVSADETLAEYGVCAGASAGMSTTSINLYAPFGGTINGTNGVLYNVTLGQIVSQTISASQGTITVTHGTVAHTHNTGTPVNISSTDKNGRWAVTTTKTGFVATYLRSISGAISWSGGNPVVASEIAYPAATNVTAVVNNGSGLLRVTCSAAHNLTTGMRVDIASATTAGMTLNGQWVVTVIDSTTIDLQSSTFAGSWTSGGTVTMTKSAWVTDHLEIFHPSTGSSAQYVQATLGKSSTRYLLAIDHSATTDYKFSVYFYDTSGTLVSTSSSNMLISYSRSAWLPAILPAGDIGQVYRDGVHCDANHLYSTNGNLWFFGMFEVA